MASARQCCDACGPQHTATHRLSGALSRPLPVHTHTGHTPEEHVSFLAWRACPCPALESMSLSCLSTLPLLYPHPHRACAWRAHLFPGLKSMPLSCAEERVAILSDHPASSLSHTHTGHAPEERVRRRHQHAVCRRVQCRARPSMWRLRAALPSGVLERNLRSCCRCTGLLQGCRGAPLADVCSDCIWGKSLVWRGGGLLCCAVLCYAGD